MPHFFNRHYESLVPCSADEHIATFLSERLFSFVLENRLSAIYADWDLHHLKRILLYICKTPTNNAPMPELVLQDHKQKLYKTWHVGSKHLLQSPNRLAITVNRYINNNITKNRSIIPFDLNIIQGSEKFSLQPTTNHHGNSIHCGHYTASVNCCGKHSIVMVLDLQNTIPLIRVIHQLYINYCIDW